MVDPGAQPTARRPGARQPESGRRSSLATAARRIAGRPTLSITCHARGSLRREQNAHVISSADRRAARHPAPAPRDSAQPPPGALRELRLPSVSARGVLRVLDTFGISDRRASAPPAGIPPPPLQRRPAPAHGRVPAASPSGPPLPPRQERHHHQQPQQRAKPRRPAPRLPGQPRVRARSGPSPAHSDGKRPISTCTPTAAGIARASEAARRNLRARYCSSACITRLQRRRDLGPGPPPTGPAASGDLHGHTLMNRGVNGFRPASIS